MNKQARAGVGEEHQFRNATEMQVATREGQIFKTCARVLRKERPGRPRYHQGRFYFGGVMWPGRLQSERTRDGRFLRDWVVSAMDGREAAREGWHASTTRSNEQAGE